MKPRTRLLVLFPVVLLFAGCPIYGQNGCRTFSDCATGLVCDDATGQCVQDSFQSDQRRCSEPDDCRTGETCTTSGRCRSGSCAVHGCVTGYECTIVSGIFSCVDEADASSTRDAAGGDAAGGDASPADAARDAALGDALADATQLDGSNEAAADVRTEAAVDGAEAGTADAFVP